MDDTQDMDHIAEEDMIDTINDPESTDALELLQLYFDQQCNGARDADTMIEQALTCASMLYEAKRYEDVVEWLDTIATRISDEEGPDSELYMSFAEDDRLEELKMKATDKIFGEDEQQDDEDDYNDDDE